MTIIIRADGNVRGGTGHVMRCIALAQGWQRTGGRAVFIQAETTAALGQRLRTEGMEVHKLEVIPGSIDDANRTIEQARAAEASWIVADGYCFGTDWQKQVKNAGFSLLILDDYGHAEYYYADLILNQNISADERLYSHREPYTRLLLGTRFALLRREFVAWRDRPLSRSSKTRRVLVTLGGSDPDNVTIKVMEALMTVPAIDVVVVVGGSNPNRRQLEALLAGRPDIRLVASAPDMAELMAWADVAVAAAGSTSWEIALMGLPSVVLIVAANQAEIAPALEREGLSVNLGDRQHVERKAIAAAVTGLLDDFPRRQLMSDRARALVDGYGVGRVITRLQAAALMLKRAALEDCRRLWEWTNDPVVRASAFNPALIPWEEHQQWFARKLGGANSVIYIASGPSREPIGQVRFDWDTAGVAEVDVSIASVSRKAGWGSALICCAVDEVFARTPVRRVVAHIKPENGASIHAFEKAGFLSRGMTNKDGHQALELTITAGHE